MPLRSVLTLTMCFAATSGCSKPRQHFAALSEVRASQTPSEAIMSLPPAFDSCTSKSGYRTSSAEPCHKLMNLADREVTAEEKKAVQHTPTDSTQSSCEIQMACSKITLFEISKSLKNHKAKQLD